MRPTARRATLATESRPDVRTLISLSRRQMCTTLPGRKEGAIQADATNSRWSASRLGTMATRGSSPSATYGAFLDDKAFASDAAAFGISRTEARGLDPMTMLVLETSYGAFQNKALPGRT